MPGNYLALGRALYMYLTYDSQKVTGICHLVPLVYISILFSIDIYISPYVYKPLPCNTE